MRRKKRLWSEALYWLALGLLLAVSVVLLFKNLGATAVRWADESRHGVNAYEMMQRGDLVVSTYRGETDYWNLKPPLSMYGIMLGYQIFGYNAMGLRVYSAGCMLLTMLWMALWMKKRHGNAASLASQLFLMACAMIYGEHFARFGDADALYVLFYTIAMLCMLDSARDVRYLYGSAVCFGLAFMSKSWHAALIPVTCFAFVCVTGQIRKLRLRQYLLLIAFGLLPVAPWAIARMRFDGLTFLQAMLGTDVVARATHVVEGHVGGWTYYLDKLLADPACVFGTVCCGAFVLWKLARRSKPTETQWGVALWLVMPVALYTLCVSKLKWYIFPCVPAFAAAVGLVCGELANLRAEKKLLRWGKAVCLCACVLAMAFWTVGNVRGVLAIRKTDRYYQVMEACFNRERDSGRHVYLQYESENTYAEIDYREWMQGEQLEAMLAGDMICLDGGTAAFVADESPAYLIAHEVGREDELLEGMEKIYEWSPLAVYWNGRE